MNIYVAHSRAKAIECIRSHTEGMVDLDYETGGEDALELGSLGQEFGILVQFRSLEHIAVRSPEGLLRGLKEPKTTFRQRHLYCLFDLARLTEAALSELERRAILHGDYILAGHLLKDATVIWE
ncbi:PHA-granule associated protein 4 [Cupriavidus sp. BIC8F]|uniref:PHA-granule associated protein 4 n=1 Tax=Cupriavidus sp. BIC8F TaxID=3079014 RepID=UPI0029160CA2|nr:PHA-granule associated protein 4 [Cupriavidus sp. BIC8F]